MSIQINICNKKIIKAIRKHSILPKVKYANVELYEFQLVVSIKRQQIDLKVLIDIIFKVYIIV